MICKNLLLNTWLKRAIKVTTNKPQLLAPSINFEYRLQVFRYSTGKQMSNRHLIDAIEKGDLSNVLKRGQELLKMGKHKEALMWLEIAAEHDDPEAAYLIGHYLATEPEISPLLGSEASTAAEVVLEINAARKAARLAKKARASKNSGVQRDSEVTRFPQTEVKSKETAIYWLKKAATADHGDSMCLIGNLLLESKVPERCREAILWYERAAQLTDPHPDALYNLGSLYFQGNIDASIDIDLAKSLDYFNRAAQVGDTSAIYWLGYCYSSGEGGVSHINPKLSANLLLKAAEKGHPKAHFHLATIFRSGLRTGDCSCGTSAHDTSSDDDIKADHSAFLHHLDLAIKAEDGADPDALFCLADMKMHGSDGMAKDESEAVRLYAQASAGGNAEATLCLGVLHYNGGAGLMKSAERAFECYNIAAEQGSLEAWRNLASMYFLGDGIPKSEETAREIMRVMFGSSPSAK